MTWQLSSINLRSSPSTPVCQCCLCPPSQYILCLHDPFGRFQIAAVQSFQEAQLIFLQAAVISPKGNPQKLHHQRHIPKGRHPSILLTLRHKKWWKLQSLGQPEALWTNQFSDTCHLWKCEDPQTPTSTEYWILPVFAMYLGDQQASLPPMIKICNCQ